MRLDDSENPKTPIQKWHEQFCREKQLLGNASPLTIRFYKFSLVAYEKQVPGGELPDKFRVNEFVLGLRERKLSASACNTYIRGINSFLTWLKDNGVIEENIKIPQLKSTKKVIKTFSDTHLKAILAFKPEDRIDLRVWTLACLLIDTGMRIEEALTLERKNIDFENLLIKILGKGDKERFVPMSFELRKTLYRYLKTHAFETVFCTRNGGRLEYHNILRDFKGMCRKCQIEGVRVSFHTLRHGFALNYLRNGGSLFHLQKAMGHEDLETTRKYVNLEVSDIQDTHLKTSLLSRLK